MATSNTVATAEPPAATHKRGTRTTAKSNGAKRTMSAEHKEALATGRREGRIVGDYLDAITARKPKRGRPVTAETIKERLDKINTEIAATSGVQRLKLIQTRMDLETDLRNLEDDTEVEKLQEDFVKVAKSYSERAGMSFAAFREFGVPAAVLKEAGLSR